MKKYFLAAIAATAIAPAAHAASVTYSDSIPLTSTNWTQSFNLQQFDPSLGTLTSVVFNLSGVVDGTISAQNLESEPVTTTLNLQATITASSGSTTLGVVVPIGSEEVTLDPFSGNILDYTGSDAVNALPLNGSASVSNTFTSGIDDLSAFIGVGSFAVNADASAQSNYTGENGGNITLITSFKTDASSEASITYTYDEAMAPIPLPAAGWALFAALGSLVAFRRYSKA